MSNEKRCGKNGIAAAWWMGLFAVMAVGLWLCRDLLVGKSDASGGDAREGAANSESAMAGKTGWSLSTNEEQPAAEQNPVKSERP